MNPFASIPSGIPCKLVDAMGSAGISRECVFVVVLVVWWWGTLLLNLRLS